MMAHTPPMCCASAMTCCTIVVLPDASGPKISVTRPRGMPPTPRAISNAMEPVGMISTAMRCWASPNFMIEPLPNCFSICEMAFSIALDLSASAMAYLCLPCQDWSAPGCVRASIVAHMFELRVFHLFSSIFQELQGGADGGLSARSAVRFAVAWPAVLVRHGMCGVDRRDVRQADGFGRRAPSRASDAGGGQTDVGGGHAAHAVGQRFGHFRAHRAMLRDEPRR